MQTRSGYPTARKLLVQELQGKAIQHHTGMVFPYSIRLQARQHSVAEAMAARSGISRNVIINQLLEVAIETVLADLPEDVREDIEGDAGDVIAAALKEKGYDIEDTREGQQ